MSSLRHIVSSGKCDFDGSRQSMTREYEFDGGSAIYVYDIKQGPNSRLTCVAGVYPCERVKAIMFEGDASLKGIEAQIQIFMKEEGIQ